MYKRQVIHLEFHFGISHRFAIRIHDGHIGFCRRGDVYKRQVFGCLTAEGYVDVPLMQKLMNAVGEMSVTFQMCIRDSGCGWQTGG